MFSYIWPIALIVISNVVYQTTAKSMPDSIDPFASVTVTYLVGAAVSCLLYYILGGRDLLQEFHKFNWTPFLLGVVIVGLEAGSIYSYKAGWPISTAFIVHSAIIAIILIAVGYVLFHEPVTWNKIVGAAVCLIGLVLINLK